MLGLHKKWAQHPDWLGRYDFATTRPLKRKWYTRAQVKTVKTNHIEYDVRQRPSHSADTESDSGKVSEGRLFFKTFIWTDRLSVRSSEEPDDMRLRLASWDHGLVADAEGDDEGEMDVDPECDAQSDRDRDRDGVEDGEVERDGESGTETPRHTDAVRGGYAGSCPSESAISTYYDARDHMDSDVDADADADPTHEADIQSHELPAPMPTPERPNRIRYHYDQVSMHTLPGLPKLRARMPGTTPSDDVSDDSRSHPTPTNGNVDVNANYKLKEHITTRQDLINAFHTLLSLEEQLHYAVLDLDGAATAWYDKIGAKAAPVIEEQFKVQQVRDFERSALPVPTWVDVPDPDEYRDMKDQYDEVSYQLRSQWEQVATVAECFSNFLSFLADHEQSRRFPDRWEEYDRFCTPGENHLHMGLPFWSCQSFPSVWAFQVAHVLSGFVDMGDYYWTSMWHYRPVCDDPCAKISKALSETYSLIEVFLIKSGTKRWGKYHRAHRKRNNRKRRTPKATLKAMRGLLSHRQKVLGMDWGSFQTLGERIRNPHRPTTDNLEFLNLLLDCYRQCATAGARSPQCPSHDSSHHSDSPVLSDGESWQAIQPPSAPSARQPPYWSGTIERRAAGQDKQHARSGIPAMTSGTDDAGDDGTGHHPQQQARPAIPPINPGDVVGPDLLRRLDCLGKLDTLPATSQSALQFIADMEARYAFTESIAEEPEAEVEAEDESGAHVEIHPAELGAVPDSELERDHPNHPNHEAVLHQAGDDTPEVYTPRGDTPDTVDMLGDDLPSLDILPALHPMWDTHTPDGYFLPYPFPTESSP